MALDYLRGFFIVVIVIDHLWRWPNLFQYITGRGELWISAAEGFVLVSGLLVGYVHGYKKRHLALAPITSKLIKRGVMLYIWMWITTLLLVAVTWNLAPKGGMAYIPVLTGDWNGLIKMMIELTYVHSLTHFLYLYALYLLVAPLVLWLLRRGLWWLVLAISTVAYVIGMVTNIESLQWQIIFFFATVLGYHFEYLLSRFRSWQLPLRKSVRLGAIGLMLVSIIVPMIIILPQVPGMYTDPVFTRRPLSFPTIPLSIVWFLGLLSLFTYLLPVLRRWGAWLLTFGQRSLTAYIIHIVPLCIIQLLLPPTDGQFWLNTLLAILSVAATWALMKIPGINRVVPR